MRWPWTRRRWAPEPINHLGPVPDGDTVLAPGQRRAADLLTEERARRAAQDEPWPNSDHEDRKPLGYRRWSDLLDYSRPLPIITPAMRWRGGDLRWDPRRR